MKFTVGSPILFNAKRSSIMNLTDTSTFFLPALSNINCTIMSLTTNSTLPVRALSNNQPIIVPDAVMPRPTGNFHPSIWGDYFLAYNSDVREADIGMEKQHEQLKEKVRNIIMTANKPFEKLNLIDAILRLGVAYQFKTEIEAGLKHIYHHHLDHKKTNDDEDLYSVALLFRLLRQQGYPVSCNVFKTFTDNGGKFKESLIGDVRGLLSLYEAAHWRVHGEDILDDALDFTTAHLNSALPNLNDSVAAQVVYALNQPIHRWTRVESPYYISFYEQVDSHEKALLDFAKIDFNLLQKLHQRELSKITSWWKDLDFGRKLPFARDRVVESYFWATGVSFEPQYSFGRNIFTKTVALVTIVDDIYDGYGTFEELVLFTDAIHRWEMSAMDQLPEYMKLIYRALLDFYTEMDEEMAKEGSSYGVGKSKSTMKDIVQAYFQEAKWCRDGYVPSMEEYMKVGFETSTFKLLATTSFVGMGDLATKEALNWVYNNPSILKAASTISRLVDDIADYKTEEARPMNEVSSVKSYMKQYGATAEVALVELGKRVTNASKDMNSECLGPTPVPMPLLARIVNLALHIHLLFTDVDNYTLSGTKLKGMITSMLIDSVPIN